MLGARGVAAAALVLAAVIAVPSVSIAQDTGTAGETTTTTAAPTDPPAPPTDGGILGGLTQSKGGGQEKPEPEQPAAPAQGTDSQAPDLTVASAQPVAQAAASASVSIGDFFFSPSSVTVAVGDTVTWHNTGQAPHNATANDGSFRTPDLNNGGSASHRFTSAGTFSYICTIHPNMHGTVRVLSASGGGNGGGGGSGGSSSSGSSTSESSAVASPNAAGTSSTLPMTGMAAGALALVGLALLASGLVVRRSGEPGPSGARRWINPF